MTFFWRWQSVQPLLPVLVLGVLNACGVESPGPEAEVRVWLERAENFAESKELGKLGRLIDTNYSDTRGNDRDALIRQLRVYGLTQGARELVISVDTLDASVPEVATLAVNLRFAATGGKVGQFNAGHYQVKLELRRSSDGDWTLINARWAPAGQPLR